MFLHVCVCVRVLVCVCEFVTVHIRVLKRLDTMDVSAVD